MIVVNCVHHIGYLVKNIEKSANTFKNMGFLRNGGAFDPIQKASILFMKLGSTNIELVEPNKESDIYPLLRKYRNAPYHICYEVDKLEHSVQSFLGEGCILIREAVPAIAISNNAKVAFLMSNNVGMIELVEF